MLTKIVSSGVALLSTVVVFILLKNKPNETQKSKEDFMKNRHSSSVWCFYDENFNKICKFENLYYLSNDKSFLFYLTNDSVISGVKSKDDLKTINLSSVGNHNNMLMKLQVVIDFNSFKFQDFLYIKEPSFLISRFKPDNIMHVIHDDILPIFLTYNHMCENNLEECVLNNRIVFFDDNNESTYSEWYNIFSSNEPYNLKKVKTLCHFKKAFAGISTGSLWFQYGFGNPQGPIEKSGVDSLLLDKFKSFVLKSFRLKFDENYNKEPIKDLVLLNRKYNRKILNENFVLSKIIQVFKTVHPNVGNIKINVMDTSVNTTSEILKIITQTNLLVGMHGSAMIYSIFLPENSAILELFPFGINPQYVSSTRALCLLPGIFYNYLSWVNYKEKNSITHPDRIPLIGGIKHLPLEKQRDIENLKTIPAVHCCHEPAYLYRMFQDTIVDNSFPVILKQVLTNQLEMSFQNIEDRFREYFQGFWYYPGPVSNVTCHINTETSNIEVNWNHPYNYVVEHFNDSQILFSLTIQIFNRIVNLETYLLSINVKLSESELFSLNHDSVVQIWIKSIIGKGEGIDGHFNCLF